MQPYRITFVGAGNIATQLSAALHKAGCAITGVCSRTETSARRLAARWNCVFTTDVRQLPSSDICIFAVKDAVLENLIEAYTQTHEDVLLVHTAGSIPLDVFKKRAERFGVFYPLQTFTKQREVVFTNVPCFVEASDAATLAQLKELAGRLSMKCFEMDSAHRRWLHLSAVFACNFVNHCYALADEMAKKSGMSFDVLLPLIEETAGKVHCLSPRAAQTGPAVRFDENVINRHLDLLSENPETAKIYRLMSESIHRLAADEVVSSE